MSARTALLLGGVVALLFAASAALTVTGHLWWADRTVLDDVTIGTGSPLLRPLRSVALMGSAETTAIISAGLVAGAVAVRRIRPVVAVLIVALAAGAVVEYLLKGHLDHPPPPGVVGGTDIKILFVATPFSFPSGHTDRVVLVGLALWLILRPWVRHAGVPILAVVAVVLYSRLALAGHWISDVIGGLLLAGIFVPALMAADAAARRSRSGDPAGPAAAV